MLSFRQTLSKGMELTSSCKLVVLNDNSEFSRRRGRFFLDISNSKHILSGASDICWKCIPDANKIECRDGDANGECIASVASGHYQGLESICLAWNKPTRERGAKLGLAAMVAVERKCCLPAMPTSLSWTSKDVLFFRRLWILRRRTVCG